MFLYHNTLHFDLSQKAEKRKLAEITVIYPDLVEQFLPKHKSDILAVTTLYYPSYNPCINTIVYDYEKVVPETLIKLRDLL